MTQEPASQEIGANNPPADIDPLETRLEVDYLELITDAAGVEIDAFGLPEALESDEDCAKLVSFAAKAKRLIKTAEGKHTSEKADYLKKGRIVDGFFKGIWTPLQARVTAAEARINAYNRAKAERERQRLAEEQRIQREAAKKLEEEAAEKRRIAEEAAETERQAAAKIRQAATPEERDTAFSEMVEAGQIATEAMADAVGLERQAGAADRRADSHARASGGSVGKLGKVAADGASSATTEYWNHRIKDASALLASLGPLGPYLSDAHLIEAIGRAKREAAAAKTIESLAIPGVEFFRDSRTSVRQAS